jgi:signal transduction histidine kinase
MATTAPAAAADFPVAAGRGPHGARPVAVAVALGLGAAAAVEELRTVAHGIYPTVLRERGPGDALRAAALTAVVDVSVADHGVGRCPPSVEQAVHLCALEALQNPARHAGPGARVRIDLRRRNNELVFSVADDGLGFVTDERPAGVGLVNMRDRIVALGGELEVASDPGRGTVVPGSVPLPYERAAASSGAAY